MNPNDARGPKNNNAMKKRKKFRKNTQSTKHISSLKNLDNYDDIPRFFGEVQDQEDQGF